MVPRVTRQTSDCPVNVAAPIDAAVSANVLSIDSTAQALSDQGVIINQGIDADATATAEQGSAIDQGNDVVDAGTPDRWCPAREELRAAATLGAPPDVVEEAGGVVDGATGDVGAADGVGGAVDGVGGAADGVRKRRRGR